MDNWFILAFGLLILCGAWFNWDLLPPGGIPLVKILGRTRVRIVYGVLGLALLVVGVLKLLG